MRLQGGKCQQGGGQMGRWAGGGVQLSSLEGFQLGDNQRGQPVIVIEEWTRLCGKLALLKTFPQAVINIPHKGIVEGCIIPAAAA